MEEIMTFLKDYWVFIVPLIVLQFALMAAAVIHILRHDTYKTGSRVIWLIISICVNIIGPVLYFTIGKGDD